MLFLNNNEGYSDVNFVVVRSCGKSTPPPSGYYYYNISTHLNIEGGYFGMKSHT